VVKKTRKSAKSNRNAGAARRARTDNQDRRPPFTDPGPTVVFRPAYSGERSEGVWAAVNRAEDPTLYLFGCALQDAEERFLRALFAAQGRKAHAASFVRLVSGPDDKREARE
jgi:hypothetical protein